MARGIKQEEKIEKKKEVQVQVVSAEQYLMEQIAILHQKIDALFNIMVAVGEKVGVNLEKAGGQKD